jgi:hypothetical protein
MCETMYAGRSGYYLCGSACRLLPPMHAGVGSSMRPATRQDILLVLPLLVFVVSYFATAPPAVAQMLKVEDIVARHLAAIGTVEARTSIKNRFVTGVGEAALRLGGRGTFMCKGQLLSEGRICRMVDANSFTIR